MQFMELGDIIDAKHPEPHKCTDPTKQEEWVRKNLGLEVEEYDGMIGVLYSTMPNGDWCNIFCLLIILMIAWTRINSNEDWIFCVLSLSCMFHRRYLSQNHLPTRRLERAYGKTKLIEYFERKDARWQLQATRGSTGLFLAYCLCWYQLVRIDILGGFDILHWEFWH